MTERASGGSTVAVRLSCNEHLDEIIAAELADLGFHAFSREAADVVAYIASDSYSDNIRSKMRAIAARLGLPAPVETVISAQNWNARWEATVTPVSVPPFMVRPSWIAGTDSQFDIVIDPKMSFGTAHHESTRLLLGSLRAAIVPGASVLDAGTGTGILAIAAARLGARRVVAFDPDPWSVENANENVELNKVSEIVTVLKGTITAVVGLFDVILANINRSVLLEYVPLFGEHLVSQGTLAMAGLLSSDEGAITDALRSTGFDLVSTAQEGEWWSVVARKVS